jgi:hypothetical protein
MGLFSLIRVDSRQPLIRQTVGSVFFCPFHPTFRLKAETRLPKRELYYMTLLWSCEKTGEIYDKIGRFRPKRLGLCFLELVHTSQKAKMIYRKNQK